MKKLLKFLLFFILFILVVLFTAPILFKGKIIKIAHEQINNNINAKASFDDINLSFFKHFPYLTAGIKQLTIEG
jgi:exopolysaccharide biosynthesis protein